MRFANTAMPETTVISQPKVDPVERILDDSRDRDVAKVVVYVNGSGDLFYDAEFSGDKAVKTEDVFDLFAKGVLAVKDGVYYAPTSCTKEGVITFPFSA